MRKTRGRLARTLERLAEAEETLRAIRSGEVDTLMVAGKEGPRVFTLQGAEHAYRLLIESMNEGALTITTDQMILYANRCFARMVKCPLERVTGGSFGRFLSLEDRSALHSLLERSVRSGAKIQVHLHPDNGPKMPVQISLSPTPTQGGAPATIGVVVTDLTEARRTEELLRALTHRVVRAQEAERGRVALELHDGITQLLCAIQFRSQALLTSLSARDGTAESQAKRLRDMAGKTAREVERVSHNLRPSILTQLGLAAAVRDAGAEFEDRTGIAVKLARMRPAGRLPAETELALYRILQEALRNAEKHARARQITVGLTQTGGLVRLTIQDDGVGFDPDHRRSRPKRMGGLGLLGMRERAGLMGGTLTVKSVLRAGTKIEVSIPLKPAAP